MASGRRGGAGDRVLESKHVIGLFMLMLVFSGVFFTLGYVMGRSQYDGQVRAASTNFRPGPQGVAPKPESSAKNNAAAHLPAETSSGGIPSQPDSDWTYYKAAKSNAPDESLKPVSSAPASRPVVPGKGRNAKPSATSSGAGYMLQVAALRRESDALALAAHLQKKKFPAFVASPHGDKYFRVQVGPYADQKSADAARKGLEGAGFKAIVKH
jgi:cell division septation protein DedD